MEKSGAELSEKLEQVLGDLENAITQSVAAMRVNSRAIIQEDTCSSSETAQTFRHKTSRVLRYTPQSSISQIGE